MNKIGTPRARLNPTNHGAGRFKQSHVSPSGRRYAAGQWYPVTIDEAKYLATVRQRSNDPNSQKAFIIAKDMTAAVAIEDAEAAAKRRIVNRARGADAMSANDMREMLNNQRHDRSGDEDSIFSGPEDAEAEYLGAVETMFDSQVEKASNRGVEVPGVKGRARKRGNRGGKNRNRKTKAAAVAGMDEMREEVRRRAAEESAAASKDDAEGGGMDDPDGLLVGRKGLDLDDDGRVVETDRAGKSTAAEFDKEWAGDGEG